MNLIAQILLLLLVAGCAGVPKPDSARPVGKTPDGTAVSMAKKGGGYYLDDGPDANPPGNLDAVPDAVPRIEPLKANANRPYVALGKTYVPATETGPFEETGLASWYGRRFHGKNTSSGEKYDMYAMTAAHPTLPIPSYASVTSLATGKTVIVRINDRGPFHSRRVIDLSYTAAHKLGIVQGGSGMVKVRAITAAEISAGRDLAANTTGIFLQLGSFNSHENAEKLLAEATTKLTKGSAALVILSESERYRVALGPYDDDSSASEAAREIQRRMNVTPVRIVRN